MLAEPALWEAWEHGEDKRYIPLKLRGGKPREDSLASAERLGLLAGHIRRTLADMAGQLGRTPNAVKYKLQSLGLYVPKPASRPWRPEDESALVAMYRSGASFADIAASFGRTENAVIDRLIRLRAGILPEHASAPEV